jgi:hypothetical protein
MPIFSLLVCVAADTADKSSVALADLVKYENNEHGKNL